MDMWTIGFADRLRFPRSRASSESVEMLAFAHIPTGTTANKGFNIDDEVNGRLVESAVALTAIGAEIKTGRATPLRHGSGCRTFGVHLTLLPCHTP
jgi:hypothetical protein